MSSRHAGHSVAGMLGTAHLLHQLAEHVWPLLQPLHQLLRSTRVHVSTCRSHMQGWCQLAWCGFAKLAPQDVALPSLSRLCTGYPRRVCVACLGPLDQQRDQDAGEVAHKDAAQGRGLGQQLLAVEPPDSLTGTITSTARLRADLGPLDEQRGQDAGEVAHEDAVQGGVSCQQAEQVVQVTRALQEAVQDGIHLAAEHLAGHEGELELLLAVRTCTQNLVMGVWSPVNDCMCEVQMSPSKSLNNSDSASFLRFADAAQAGPQVRACACMMRSTASDCCMHCMDASEQRPTHPPHHLSVHDGMQSA